MRLLYMNCIVILVLSSSVQLNHVYNGDSSFVVGWMTYMWIRLENYF